MKKTLMLVKNNSDFLECKINNLYVKEIYNNMSNLRLKIFRNSFLVGFALNEWKKNINDYDTIILFDSSTTLQTLKWIRKKNKNARIIFYYFNSIKTTKKNRYPDIIKKYNAEVWSYNIYDCEKYNMKYNKQVYIKDIFDNIKEEDIKYDLIFLGKNKGREKELRNIYNYCIINNIKTYFYIPDLLDFPDNKCKDGSFLKYCDYIKMLKKSRAVLDIVNEDNVGLTLRPIEAMFTNKKLITNYEDIKKYDLYNNNNIYILNNEKNSLKDFLYSDKNIYWNEEIANSYDIKEWIKRFKI